MSAFINFWGAVFFPVAFASPLTFGASFAASFALFFCSPSRAASNFLSLVTMTPQGLTLQHTNFFKAASLKLLRLLQMEFGKDVLGAGSPMEGLHKLDC